MMIRKGIGFFSSILTVLALTLCIVPKTRKDSPDWKVKEPAKVLPDLKLTVDFG